MNLEQELNKQFVIPVIRHQHEQDLLSLCEALAEGGLKILEVTLMSDAALKVIERLAQRKDLIIAAGTVLTATQIKAAKDSGAAFCVSPGLNLAMLDAAQFANMTFIPGVLSPTEVMQAQLKGCEMVKVFPVSSVGGPAYIKNLQGPFPRMKWMATGGINLQDVAAYKKAGVTCVGLGSNLTPKELLDARNWQGITRHVSELLKQI